MFRWLNSLRRKFLLVIAVCVAPGLAGAWWRSRAIEAALQRDMRESVAMADVAFEADLQEDTEQRRMALRIAASDPRLIQDLESADHRHARELLTTIGRNFIGARVWALDSKGEVVAEGIAAADEADLARDTAIALKDSRDGASFTGLLSMADPKGRAWYTVTAVPVSDERDAHVGAIALAYPLSDLLDDQDKTLVGFWSMTVNGQVVGSSTGHPAPDLQVPHEREVGLVQAHGHDLAAISFHPEMLQRPGVEAVVTATRDFTVRATHSRTTLTRLYLSVALGLVLAVVAAWLATRRTLEALDRLHAGAKSVARGALVEVPEVYSNDETERLIRAFNGMVRGLRERDGAKPPAAPEEPAPPPREAKQS